MNCAPNSEAMSSLEERIIAFTADEIGVKRGRIRLDSRLLHDLGMDGDDAVEFFEEFSKRFHVDVTPLSNHWAQHFGPEIGGGPILLAVIGLAVGAATLLHKAVPAVPTWAWCIPLVPSLIWCGNKVVTARVVPVTVRDLVNAASTGEWAE
ncbi:MAG: DUF1493 family protein [Bryobacteraceae bacterium]|jgi:acyl carrier protein